MRSKHKFTPLFLAALAFAFGQAPAPSSSSPAPKAITEKKRDQIATLIIRLQSTRINMARMQQEYAAAEKAAADIQQQLEGEIAEARKIDGVAAECVPDLERNWSCPAAKEQPKK